MLAFIIKRQTNRQYYDYKKIFKKSLGVDTMYCNGIVPLALLILSLMLMKYLAKKITIKRKETPMEQVIVKTEKLKTGLKSMIETIWAIGTSVAATGALREIKLNYGTI
jgi:TRAP-type C4-dicarboxylate transport system permease large subunit